MSSFRITYVGASTALVEIAGLRLLTDPVFDPPGGRYSFGWGTRSRKRNGPAIDAQAVGPVDAVLLSHDQHADNLDRAGRELLPRATRVLTTQRGARRLGGNARGLAPWARFDLDAHGTRVRVVATPARHGPPLSRPVVGDVIGFLLEWEGQQHGALYLSGDTVWFRGLREVAQRFDVGTFVPYLGARASPSRDRRATASRASRPYGRHRLWRRERSCRCTTRAGHTFVRAVTPCSAHSTPPGWPSSCVGYPLASRSSSTPRLPDAPRVAPRDRRAAAPRGPDRRHRARRRSAR